MRRSLMVFSAALNADSERFFPFADVPQELEKEALDALSGTFSGAWLAVLLLSTYWPAVLLGQSYRGGRNDIRGHYANDCYGNSAWGG